MSYLNTSNTSPTPSQAGRWVIPHFGPPPVLKWEPLTNDVDDIPAGHALVRIIAAGIGGTDNLQRTGGYPNPRCHNAGFTPGYDFVGEVVKFGPDDGNSRESPGGDLQIGDRVASMCVIGAHATHITIPIADILKIERYDDVVKVCALPLNYMTAWGMLKRAGVELKPGSAILIGSAAGGVGTAIAQIAKAFNMGLTMIGTCSASKFAYVRSLGVIPVDRHDPNLWQTVRDLTPNQKGVDVAYDAVGSQESVQHSFKATKNETGRVIVISVMANIAPDGSGVLTNDNMLDNPLPPRSSFWGVEAIYYQTQKELFVKDFYGVLARVRSGVLNPVIAELLPLRDAVKANELLISGVGVLGKMEFIIDKDLADKLGVE